MLVLLLMRPVTVQSPCLISIWGLIVLLILIALPSCGGKAVLSDDAVRIRKVNDFVKEVEHLYEQRNERLLNLFAADYLKGIKEPLLKDMKSFSSISLDMFVHRIEIGDEDVKISIHWNGVWKDGAKTFREGGSMVLLTSQEESIRITGVIGNSPFGISSILSNY